MKIQIRLFIIILVMFNMGSSIFAGDSKPYLSSIHATRESPIYTTYAASLERSEFILDEGYHFAFYDSTRGADFITDTGGNICLAFKQGANYVYRLKDMVEEPVISLSYPDMVKYHYKPIQQIRVDVTFLVYSSHIAIMDIKLKNRGNSPVEFQIVPFMRNEYRVFNDVAFHPNKHAITFTHEELPDSWTLDHGVPYVNPVRDVFLISHQPDRQTSYLSYQWGHTPIPLQVDLNKDPNYVVWGKIVHTNGERCRHRDPSPTLEVRLDRYPDKILTKTAPRWGRADKNINPYGYYSIELGNFGEIKNGDVYTIRYHCRETGEIAVLQDTIRNIEKEKHDIRKDLQLSDQRILQTPVELGRDIWGSGTEMRLYWDHPDEDVTFQVYRRDYQKNGFYRLLAKDLKRSFYTDKNIGEEQIFGYVVVAVKDAQRSMPTREINNIAGSDFLTDLKYPNQLKNDVRSMARVIAQPLTIKMEAGSQKHLRIVRAVSRMDTSSNRLIKKAEKVLGKNLNDYVHENEKLFSNIPQLDFKESDKEILYWSAFNLMRQVMLPPEGECGYNYYVFSREPTWGWGHGGQVFHESLTMLAYAFMDPVSAMHSQRIYLERQHDNGYINYRTGPYLNETIPYNDQLTTSAPWYAWQNWEVYKITKDEEFLKDIYASSKAFYEYYTSHRDSDGDGLCEWGAHAVLESVRDSRVAVWDQVGWPSHFEGVDVNTMLVKEAKSLSKMADKLGLKKESQHWRSEAATRQKLINDTMWDQESGFYYHVDKKDNDFTFQKKNDLKRKEIIGFLPLWAGVADQEQADRLIQHVTDSSEFWRKYGIPSLSAADPYYNPKGYWNGPVWVEWDYLILRGLKQYGYIDLAKELTNRVSANMIARLKKDHQLWEFYSPDQQWAGYHKQYIWAGIINAMFLETMESAGK